MNTLYMQQTWEQWIHDRLSESDRPERVPITGFPLMPLAALAMPYVMPTALAVTAQTSQAAAITALRYTLQHVGATSALGSSLLSLPTAWFASSLRSKQRVDHAILQANMGRPPQDWISQGSKHAVILGVAAASTLFFEFMGMYQMAEETKKSRILWDAQKDTWTGYLKNEVHKRYSDTPFYTGPAYLKNLKPNDVDPVRAVYNILVGINKTLFIFVRGESTDPTVEIIHWTSILFYWEILARLVNLYGWSPVGAASKLLFSRLWAEHKKKNSFL